MRSARLTWKGAFHHVMNRGINKLKVFQKNNLKRKYIEMMSEKSKKYGIRIFAYCVMNNHFHICLENTSGNLSDFMKSLNGHYGQYYRHITNSKGYVFEDRFKSTLIQDENYLLIVIKYILQNPVRSLYVSDPFDYQWSSINEYFSTENNTFVVCDLVEEQYFSKKEFSKSILSDYQKNLDEQLKNQVKFCGDELLSFRENLVDVTKLSKMNLIEKIQNNFEYEHSIIFSEINIRSHYGKKLRKKFLLRLRDELGLTYKEIQEIDLFSDLSIDYLRKIVYFLQKET